MIKKSSPDGLLSPIAKIWAICSFPTIFFGFLFDEFFGFSHAELAEKLGFSIQPLYHGLERLHNVQEVLLLTIATGFVLVLLGFALGFVKEYREKNMLHAAAKLSWVFLLLSGAFLLFSIATGSNDFTALAVGVIVFLASTAVIFKAEGIVGIMEIPSIAGNILSFSRILAVGLASAVVAIIINDLVFPDPKSGFLIFITFPIFLFGHMFNTFLGMFESLIQGARLNYVEFFSKFYSGGGREFSPFKEKRKFTKRR
ncbi:MAG: hypothetical protein HYW50_00330 [Candidatus Diapherotrites archaeon]|nr:hypothetical protein [Candidatus Diapherotrites archaeon]